jgi:hypothetical protein
MDEYKSKFTALMDELKTYTGNVSAFSCMVDDNDDEALNDDDLVFTKDNCDRQMYIIEHKLFIVVSGSLRLNGNNVIMSLMPLLAYISDKAV